MSIPAPYVGPVFEPLCLSFGACVSRLKLCLIASVYSDDCCLKHHLSRTDSVVEAPSVKVEMACFGAAGPYYRAAFCVPPCSILCNRLSPGMRWQTGTSFFPTSRDQKFCVRCSCDSGLCPLSSAFLYQLHDVQESVICGHVVEETCPDLNFNFFHSFVVKNCLISPLKNSAVPYISTQLASHDLCPPNLASVLLLLLSAVPIRFWTWSVHSSFIISCPGYGSRVTTSL